MRFITPLLVLVFMFCVPDFPERRGIPWPLLLDSGGQGYGDDGKLRIFVTAATYRGDFGAGGGNWYDRADALCQSDPNRPTFGTYHAYLGGSGRHACSSSSCSTGGASENLNWVFTPNTGYFRSADGRRILTTDSSATHQYPNPTDVAMTVDGSMYWTGMDNDWTVLANNCSDWSSNSGGTFGATGDGGDGATALEFIPHRTCDNFYPLLCVRQ